jgi:DNA topoisomerase IB
MRNAAIGLGIVFAFSSVMSTTLRRPRKQQRQQQPPPIDPVLAAKTAGLRYANDGRPGIRRQRSGRAFRYFDVDSADVNDYLREITGEEFTAKDFRTWAGTILAAMALQEFEKFDTQTQAKKNVVRAIESVAERLGNTPSVCRKCYVHPVILDSYLDGSMIDTLRSRAKQEMEESLGELRPEEAAVMALLQNRLAREGEGRSR